MYWVHAFLKHGNTHPLSQYDSQGLKDQHSTRASKTIHPSLHWPPRQHSSFQFTSTKKSSQKWPSWSLWILSLFSWCCLSSELRVSLAGSLLLSQEGGSRCRVGLLSKVMWPSLSLGLHYAVDAAASKAGERSMALSLDTSLASPCPQELLSGQLVASHSQRSPGFPH